MSQKEPYEIVRIHRERWVEKFVSWVHDDNVEEARIAAEVVLALTECFWDVFHGEVR